MARRFELIVFDFTIYMPTVDVCFFLDSISGMTKLFILVSFLGK